MKKLKMKINDFLGIDGQSFLVANRLWSHKQTERKKRIFSCACYGVLEMNE